MLACGCLEKRAGPVTGPHAGCEVSAQCRRSACLWCGEQSTGGLAGREEARSSASCQGAVAGAEGEAVMQGVAEVGAGPDKAVASCLCLHVRVAAGAALLARWQDGLKACKWRLLFKLDCEAVLLSHALG